MGLVRSFGVVVYNGFMDRELDRLMRKLGGQLRWARTAEAFGLGVGVAAVVATVGLVAIFLVGLFSTSPAHGAYGLVDGGVRAAWLLVAAGGFLGAGWAMRTGHWAMRAARFLDAKYDLKERLTTAAELAWAHREDDVARYVFTQAREAASTRIEASTTYWRFGRRLTSGVVLSLVLCAGVSWAVHPGTSQADADAAALARAMDAMSPGRRADLAEQLRQAARLKGSAATAESLDALAQVVVVADEQALRELVETLREKGMTLRQILAPKLQASLGLDEQARDSQPGQPATREGTLDAQAGNEVRAVRVYNPAYASHVQAAASPSAAGDSTAISQTLPAPSAWAQARRQASRALREESCPPAYRQILRQFFQGDE